MYKYDHSIFCSVGKGVPQPLCHVCGDKDLSDYLYKAVEEARREGYSRGYDIGRKSRALENPNL